MGIHLPDFRALRRHDRQYFYKYVTANVAHIVLATRTLRWSSPLLFNDPFDVPINLELPFTPAELQVAITHRIADMMESGTPILQPQLGAMQRHLQRHNRADLVAQIVEEFRKWPVAGVDLPSLDEIQQFWERMRPDMRILCLSERPDIPPNWAHYGDGYRGAVLEFECKNDIDTALLLARPVKYQSEPPRLASLEDWLRSILKETPFDLTEFFSDYQYIKQSHWDSELEWRLVSYNRQGQTGLFSDFPLDPRELSGLYLGSRIPDVQAQTLQNLLRHGVEHVRVFKAIENQKTLSMTFEPIV